MTGLVGKGFIMGAVLLVALAILVWDSGRSEAKPAGALNIKTAYGAKCDGRSIDTAAFMKAAASGKDIYIPAGTCVVGKEIMLKPGADWRGAGKTRTSVRNYNPFRLTNNTSVSNLRMFNASKPANPTGVAFTVDNATARSRAAVRNVKIRGFQKGIYVGRPANGTTHHHMSFVGNNFSNNRLGINAVKLNNSSISRNTFVGQNAAIEFYGGSRNLFSRNTIDGRRGAGGNSPRVGILFLPKDEELGGHGEVRNNRVIYNTVRNFTEEGISFDTRAAEPWNTNIREVDTVASVYRAKGQARVKLTSRRWSNAPAGRYNGYLLTALTGSQRGKHFRIMRHSGALFYMGPAEVNGGPNPVLRLKPGDQLAIGSPFIGNQISDNTVDASKAFVGIGLHGYAYGSKILRNKVVASPTAPSQYKSQGYPNPVGIRVTSLTGVADGRGPAKGASGSCNTINDRNCDGNPLNDPGDAYTDNNFLRKVPSEDNEVYGNTVRGGDVAFNLFNYTGNPDHNFVSYGNRAGSNTFVNGLQLRVKYHELAESTN